MESASYRFFAFSRNTHLVPVFRHHTSIFGSRRNLSVTCIRAAKTPKAPKGPKTPAAKSTRQPLEYRTPTRKTPLPSSQSQSSTKRSNPLRHRTIPIIFLSITAFAISGYSTYLYVTIFRMPLPPSQNTSSNFTTQEDVSSRYDSIASNFDDEVSLTERIMGLTSLRKKLTARAHGDVLEVSIGTGRNLEFYDWDFQGVNGVGKVGARGDIKRGKVRSFTAVDQSAEMLEVAHDKFTTLYPGILGVRWVVGDAAQRGTIPNPPRNANERSGSIEGGKKYDTVIQTMGLCSVKDPVSLLRNLGECVVPDTGRILLLEHGRGRWEWLNGVLDRFAEGHAREFGCWWNRDLGAVVEACGLEVVELERPRWWHGGTTWWIELRKPGALADGNRNGDGDGDGLREPPGSVKATKSWWS